MNALALRFDTPVPYAAALRWQDELVAARQAGLIPDVILVLQHTPVITRGIRTKDAHVLASPRRLAELGVEVHDTPRGGDVTCHGPGQWVLYPILRLTGEEADAHVFVSRLEETAIRTAAEFGVPAERRHGKTGVWTQAGKLAAVGVRFQKWVSSHGIAFNVAPDLDHFGLIVPCGLMGERVTSLRAILGDRCPTLTTAREALLRHFSAAFGRELECRQADDPGLPESIARILSRMHPS